MTGMQKTLCINLHEIVAAIEAGKYGIDDDVDTDALLDDLEDILATA